jgi:hypothetical protein
MLWTEKAADMLRLRYIPLQRHYFNTNTAIKRLLNVRKKEWLRKVRYLCERTQASVQLDSNDKHLSSLSECSMSWYNEKLQILILTSHN